MATPATADRNLLFGILAVQLDFVSRDQLIAAMNAWVLEKSKPIGEILLAQKATPELFNLQTRMIAGDEWDDLRREVDDDALERAQENLRAHFSFVGLTEEFDASISLLGRIFGWSVPFYVKRNVTARKPRSSSVDVETRSLLRDANAFDLKLYEYARNLFEAQRRAGGVAFERELRRFQRLNRVWSCAYESCEAVRRGVAHLVGGRTAKAHRLKL